MYSSLSSVIASSKRIKPWHQTTRLSQGQNTDTDTDTRILISVTTDNLCLTSVMFIIHVHPHLMTESIMKRQQLSYHLRSHQEQTGHNAEWLLKPIFQQKQQLHSVLNAGKKGDKQHKIDMPKSKHAQQEPHSINSPWSSLLVG